MKKTIFFVALSYSVCLALWLATASRSVHYDLFAWHSENVNPKLMGNPHIPVFIPGYAAVFLGYSTAKRDGE